MKKQKQWTKESVCVQNFKKKKMRFDDFHFKAKKTTNNQIII